MSEREKLPSVHLRLSDDHVVETTSTPAFKGYGGRVHTSTAAALTDIASNELASQYLKSGTGAYTIFPQGKGLTFAELLSVLEWDIEFTRKVMSLVEFKRVNQL